MKPWLKTNKRSTSVYNICLGGDDGYLHVWDLRRFKQKTPIATFKHHTDSITTVEWHPADSTVFAAGGSDNQITLWDLSVEKDSEVGGEDVEVWFSLLLRWSWSIEI